MKSKWQMPCIHPLDYFYSWFMSIEALKTRPNDHFFVWWTEISQHPKTDPPKFPYQPLHIDHFWVNGSKFSNSVENTWKYIKFATFYVKTGKSQNFEAGPPPIALSMGIPYIAKTELNFPRQTVFWGTGQSDRAKNGQIPSSQWYLGDSVSFFWFFDFKVLFRP